MAYMWDEKGNIVGNGLPDGVQVNLKQYQDVVNQYKNSAKSFGSGFYPSMSRGTDNKLSDAITKFVYRNGKVQGFIPELEKVNSIGYNQNFAPVTNKNRTGPQSGSPEQVGYYVDVGGIVFDENSKSGDIPDGSDVIFSTEGGAPLAEFQRNGKTMGYMRLATNQEKQADNLRLGNKSGTQSGNVRQNAQRKTLL